MVTKLSESLGDLLTIEDWELFVKNGSFIDYDGFGYFANLEFENDDMEIYPSLVAKPEYEKEKANWTHVIWFNR